MAKETQGKIAVLVKLDPEVVEEIDRRSAGPGRLFETGGRAGWIKALVHAQLGYKPKSNGRALKRLDLPLHLVDPTGLKPVEELIVRLGQRGWTLTDIVHYLNDEKILPPEGSSKWYRSQIERILTAIISERFAQTVGVK